jgi:hypothetical protein
MKPIFLGIPVLNRFDLLEQSIQSLDYPNLELYIVNNNTTDSAQNQHLQELSTKYNFQIFSPRYNLGVAASWNRIITTAWSRGYDFVYIGSNDTILSPHSLQTFVDIEKPEIECLWMLNKFNFFCIRLSSIPTIGLFDENFMPAYFEDNDYMRRIQLSSLQMVELTSDSKELNGRILPPAPPSHHIGSQTIHSNPRYKELNNYTFNEWNKNHYIMKWGGEPGSETYHHPYNNPSNDIRWWPDPGGSVAIRDWDFMK